MNILENKIGSSTVWPAYIKRAFYTRPFNPREQMIVAVFSWINDATLCELKNALVEIGIDYNACLYIDQLWTKFLNGQMNDYYYSFHVASGKWIYAKSKLPKMLFDDDEVQIPIYIYNNALGFFLKLSFFHVAGNEM